jgi:putative FmdB family regulatory protein
MPTYEYICEDCGHEFEQFQGITARALRKCPECGKPSLNRLIGVGSGIIFKGSGFYATDYRSESYEKAEKSEKEPAGKGATEKKTHEKTKDSKTTDKSKTQETDKKKST